MPWPSRNEFEEISEQKERALLSEIRPVIRTLRSEQAKLDEIRRRMEKAGPRPGERARNKFDAEIAVRKTKQAEVLRKINLNQRVVDRVVTRMRRFLERIKSGERDLLELGKAARLNQGDLRLLVPDGDGINPNTVRTVLRRALQGKRDAEIYRQQMADQKKPPQVLDKIVEGKLEKFFTEACLLDQPFIKDASASCSTFQTFSASVVICWR